MTPVENVRCKQCRQPITIAAARAALACPSCGSTERPVRVQPPPVRSVPVTRTPIARDDVYQVPWLLDLEQLPASWRDARAPLRIDQDEDGADRLVIVRADGRAIVVAAGAYLLRHLLRGGAVVLSACSADELAAMYEVT